MQPTDMDDNNTTTPERVVQKNMSTYTQILYHIVFSTKNRKKVLTVDNRQRLLKYIWGIIKNQNSHLYRINAVDDHVHILTHLHPTICLSDFIKTIKINSTKWIKNEKIFPKFTNWQDGYGAFTYSINEKNVVIKYIKSQEEHHKKVSFIDEFKKLLDDAGIKYDEKYLK